MTEACVILNDIHIDIMDYIKPAYCSENQVSPRTKAKICFPDHSAVPQHVDRI